jgi:uncharacterized paraquat-inducible protein A
MKCKDCECEIDTANLENNEIVACSQCGCEYEWKDGNLVYLELDGEGWGE